MPTLKKEIPQLFSSLFYLNFNLLVLDNYRICSDAEARVGLAFTGFCIVSVAVDGTHSDTVSDPSSTKGTHGMRTGVVYGTELATFIENSDSSSVDGKGFSASFSDG